jgi:hypothetical protein
MVEFELLEPRYSVADVTAEALAVVLSRGTHEAIASLSGEARGCIDVLAGRYNKMTDESLYISAFTGDPCKYDRVNRPSIRLRQPCLSLLWLLQPDKLQEVISHKSIKDSGFWARCLMVHTRATRQRKTGQRRELSRTAVANWRQLIRTLISEFHNAKTIQTVRATPEVIGMFIDYENRIISRSDELADVQSYAMRWKEIAWRLLLVIHVAHHGPVAASKPLEPCIAQAALDLMDWFSEQQLNVLSASREKKKRERYDELYEILSNAHGNSLSLRDMLRRHGFEAPELKQLAADHSNEIRIEKQMQAGPGRPSHIIKLIVE